ncbi:MAG: hypothetical protein PHH91_12735 [Desulfuromonadaceae bacterium]|nr:hypothetical protein [Desulfuromonadaceae bacterium]
MDHVQIDSPVKLENDSKARVAFDLMEKIALKTADDNQKKSKEYWLSLYRQCYKAADGALLKYILQED